MGEGQGVRAAENRLLAAGSDGKLYLCQCSLLHAIRTGTSAVNSVVYTPDGSAVVSGGADRAVRLYSAADGSLTARLLRVEKD